jgi:hypothetical protein
LGLYNILTWTCFFLDLTLNWRPFLDVPVLEKESRNSIAARAAALALAATAAFSAATARAAAAASVAAFAAALAASIISSSEEAEVLAASAISRRRVARSPEASGDGRGSAASQEVAAVLSPASSRFRGGRWVFRSDGSISRSQFKPSRRGTARSNAASD